LRANQEFLGLGSRATATAISSPALDVHSTV
jgi:hypothetical protein